jgi:hypothetical protein
MYLYYYCCCYNQMLKTIKEFLLTFAFILPILKRCSRRFVLEIGFCCFLGIVSLVVFNPASVPVLAEVKTETEKNQAASTGKPNIFDPLIRQLENQRATSGHRLEKGVGVVFIRKPGPEFLGQQLGHVGYCVKVEAGKYLCGSVENSSGSPFVYPGGDNSAWTKILSPEEMFEEIKKRGYTEYRYTTISNPNIGLATQTANNSLKMGYQVTNLNCLDITMSVIRSYGTSSKNPFAKSRISQPQVDIWRSLSGFVSGYTPSNNRQPVTILSGPRSLLNSSSPSTWFNQLDQKKGWSPANKIGTNNIKTSPVLTPFVDPVTKSERKPTTSVLTTPR